MQFCLCILSDLSDSNGRNLFCHTQVNLLIMENIQRPVESHSTCLIHRLKNGESNVISKTWKFPHSLI